MAEQAAKNAASRAGGSTAAQRLSPSAQVTDQS
eukprot:COSAG05_NODE_17762_length_319_cov_1.177273_1_plen_32_part_01